MVSQRKPAASHVDKGLLDSITGIVESMLPAIIAGLTKTGGSAKKGLSVAGGGALDVYKDFVPESDFRTCYSDLVKAIWADPSIQRDIESNPRLLKTEYNFPIAPKRVRFATAVGLPTPEGYEGLQTDFSQDGGTVTIYVPPLPNMDESLADKDVSICCSCCPCCCCT
jgi:hypothetical protein